MSYYSIFASTTPEIALVVAALAILFLDLQLLRGAPASLRWRAAAGLALAGTALAMACLQSAPDVNLLGGTFLLDPLIRLVKLVLLLLGLCAVLLSVDAPHTAHVGEYVALLLLATSGLLLLVSTEDLVLLFIALELASVSLYLLTAFARDSGDSAEAGLKYFLFGGVSAAFTLFGISFLYGLTGTTSLASIAARLGLGSPDPLLLVAMAMTTLGFGFKIAAAPLHLWAPDAYQGAPVPSAALIASGSKLGSFFIFAKVFLIGFAGQEGHASWNNFGGGWVALLAFLAAFSILLGNFAALGQISVRRLLAYSAIAHGGYTLLGFLGRNPHGLTAVIYYAIIYSLTVMGALGVASIVERQGAPDHFSSYSGLARRAPVIAACMLIFLLSLAGIPPLPGFFGKFYLFVAAANMEPNLGLLWLIILAIAMSALSLYYYLKVLKQIYVLEPAPAVETMIVPGPVQIVLVVLALLVAVLGCLPNLLIEPISQAIQQALK